MHQRTVRLFALLAGTFVLLLITGASALGAMQTPMQQDDPTPSNAPLTQQDLENFWHEMYPAAEMVTLGDESNVYRHDLLAKAEPDECYNGIGVPVAITDTVPDCVDGQSKVNEAYVWGMTDYSDTIWFGTAPNVHCLVIGGFLGATSPIETDSYTCEFGGGPYAPPLPDAIGDWRPPSLYRYDNASETLLDVTPTTGLARLAISNTLGIRSATTFGDYVFFAGPAFTPTASINVFLYNAATQQLAGVKNIPGYGNIRKWLEVDGVLYTAVGTPTGGAVLRYTGNPLSVNPLERIQFEEVGTLDADGAELALHEGRIFVNTWPSSLTMTDVVAGLWMSPLLPDGGLTTADAGNWEQVFGYDEYEPDPLIARTYGGGALYSYEGDLFWGTMHVPFLATVAHLQFYGPSYSPDEADILAAALGSQRSVTIFQGRNFGTPDEEVEVAYGMPELPAFDPISYTWGITTTLLGPPKYGLSGFGNPFNNYTWSMDEYDGQLFVGTMDWSYLLTDIFETFLNQVELPLDLEISLPAVIQGADLYRFYDTQAPAIAESVNGVGNYTSYGVRNLVGREDGLYLGMANPMNLLTDLFDDKPEGGWELIRLTRHLIPLTVNFGSNGSGTVVSEPAGINCNDSCEGSFDYGFSIALTPTAEVGSTFTGWSDTCSGIPCIVELEEATTIVANFTLDVHTLDITLAGDGSGSVVSDPAGINCGTACDEEYNYGTLITLTATPEDDSLFTGWEGACSGTAACVVTVTESKNVTATFTNNRFPLIVNLVGSGSGHVASLPAGIACSQPTCSADFDKDTAVSLSAIAFSGSSFESWSGDCVGTNACDLTIGAGTNIVTATFSQNPQEAAINVDGITQPGKPLTFTATLNMNPITECVWDFGDEQTEACDLGGAQTVVGAGVEAVMDVTIQTTHAYTQAGVYLVTVTASNDAGSVTAVQQLIIQPPTAEEPIAQPRNGELFFPYLNR